MEPTTEARKTFRLTDAAAATLDGMKARHSTENAAINYALTEWPKQMLQKDNQIRQLNGELATVQGQRLDAQNEVKKLRTELDELKNALALIGKFLHPAE